MYRDPIDLISEFRADWDAALRPDVDDLFARCDPSEHAALSALIEDFLLTAPTPPYSPVQQRRLREKVAPIVERVMNDPAWIAESDQLQAAWRDKPWLAKRWIGMRSKVSMWRWRVRAWRQPKPWE